MARFGALPAALAFVRAAGALGWARVLVSAPVGLAVFALPAAARARWPAALVAAAAAAPVGGVCVFPRPALAVGVSCG